MRDGQGLGAKAPASEMRSPIKLRRKLGSQLLGGVVLYTCTRAYTHDSGLHVIPINHLWHPRSTSDADKTPSTGTARHP